MDVCCSDVQNDVYLYLSGCVTKSFISIMIVYSSDCLVASLSYFNTPVWTLDLLLFQISTLRANPEVDKRNKDKLISSYEGNRIYCK